MRSVILNMMLLGIATCIVENDAFARNYVDREEVISENSTYEKSQRMKSFNRDRKKNLAKKSMSKNSALSRNRSKKQEIKDELAEKNTEISVSVKSKIPPAPPRPLMDKEIDEENRTSNIPPAPTRPLTDKEIDEKATSNIPPAPPRPQVSGSTPPPPPPPMGMSKSSSFSAAKQQEMNVRDVMENLRGDLNEFLDENDVKTMANVVNLYLQGNKEKISEGISTAESSMLRLSSRLDEDLKVLNKLSESNPKIEAFCDILQNLPKSLKKLSVKGYRSDDRNKSRTFREISQDIKDIASEYFQKVMTSEKILKDIPNLKALKDAEIVLERAVVLSDSFSNLVDLSEEARNEAFSERSTKDVLAILNLKRYISDKLKETSSASSKNFVSLPTGDVIAEKEYLEKARAYIEDTCKGRDRLQKLLDMRDVLNNKYTTITSTDQGDSKRDPLVIIRTMDDRIADLGDLLQEANEKPKIDNYSQFGKMFTEGDVGYGGALISSVNQWISSENLAEFSNDKIRNAFRGKELTGDIVDEYLKLLTDDMNLCRSFAKSVISTISRRKNFKASSYSSISKQTESKKEDRKVLVEITNKTSKLGTSSDPKKDKNLIPFSMLRKNCEEYVQEISSAENDIRAIPEILNKIKTSFSKKISDDQLVTYVNSIINSYFVFKDFQPQGDQISFSVTNTENGLLSSADTPNVVFALAQNCNLAVKQNALLLFPTSKDTNNMWVFKMALDLQTAISKTIDAISDVSAKISEEDQSSGISEIIERLNNLEQLIKSAISQDNSIKQVTNDLKKTISNTKKKISSTKERFDEATFIEITDNLQNLMESTTDAADQYEKNQQIDEISLSKVIENLQKLDAEISKTIAQNKNRSAKSERKIQKKVGREKMTIS